MKPAVLLVLLAACGADDAPTHTDATTPDTQRVDIPAKEPVGFVLDGDRLDIDGPEAAQDKVLFLDREDVTHLDFGEGHTLVQFTDSDGAARKVVADGVLTLHAVALPPTLSDVAATPEQRTGEIVPVTAHYTGVHPLAAGLYDGDRVIGTYYGHKLVILRTTGTAPVAFGSGSWSVFNMSVDLDVDFESGLPEFKALPELEAQRLHDVADHKH